MECLYELEAGSCCASSFLENKCIDRVEWESLMRWVTALGMTLHIHTNTLFLTKNYVNRFMSAYSVIKEELLLVGTTALFIASKFDMEDAVELDMLSAYTQIRSQDILAKERTMLSVLQYRLFTFTEITFFHLYCRQVVNALLIQDPKPLIELGLEFLSISISTYDCATRLPSHIAAATLALVTSTPRGDACTPFLSIIHDASEINDCISVLYTLYLRSGRTPWLRVLPNVTTLTDSPSSGRLTFFFYVCVLPPLVFFFFLYTHLPPHSFFFL